MKGPDLSYSSALRCAFASGECVTEALVSSLDEQPDTSVLEFAAGTGVLAGLTGDGRELVLVEHDPEAIETTSAPSSREKAQCRLHPPWRIARPDDSIGAAVMARNAVYRLRPSSFCFSEAHRLLRPGGRLLAVLDDVDGSERNLSVPAWRTRFGPHEMEERLYWIAPEPLLVKSVLSASSSTIHKYDFVCPVPPIARVMHIMRGLGFDVAEPVRLDSGRDPNAKGRSLALMEATKASATPSVEYTQARETYDEIAESYDEFVGGAEYRVPAWLIDEVGKKYGAGGRSAPRAVLDLGCGNGYLGKRLQDANVVDVRFFGCDFSREMVEQCRSSGRYEAALTYDLNRGVPIVESELFDIVLACGCLEFLESCEELVTGVRRVLRPGGSTLLTFQRRQAGDQVAEVPGRGHAGRLETRTYSTEEVETLLVSNGLAVRSLRTDVGYRSPTTGRNVPYILVHAERGG